MNIPTTDQPAASPADGLLSRIDNSINTVLSYFSSMWIFAIMVLICVDVALRTFFNSPIAGVAEFVAASVVALVFLQLPSVIARRRMLRAEMFVEPFEARYPRAAALLDAVYAAIGLFMFWRIVGWAIPDMIKAWTEGTYAGAQGVYEIPLWPFDLAMVIGTGLGLLQFVRHVIAGLAKAVGVTGSSAKASIVQGSAPPGGPVGLAIVLAIVVGMAAFCGFVFTADLSPSAVGIWCLLGMLAMVALGMPIPLALLALSYVGIWVARQGEFMAINTWESRHRARSIPTSSAWCRCSS
jgi:C4-dicarboxylate transporter DctM subunit